MLNPLIPELCCSDFENSFKFYTGVLEFKTLFQRKENKFAMLEHQGAQLMIEQMNQPGGRSWLAAETLTPFGRGINLQIFTKNINALYKRVQNSDAKIFMEIEEKWYRMHEGYGGNRQFIVLDPDGYLLRFAEDLGTRDYA